jgi:hypothetical protein
VRQEGRKTMIVARPAMSMPRKCWARGSFLPPSGTPLPNDFAARTVNSNIRPAAAVPTAKQRLRPASNLRTIQCCLPMALTVSVRNTGNVCAPPTVLLLCLSGFQCKLLSSAVQQCYLRSPKSSLEALMAYPDVKLVDLLCIVASV